MLRATHKTIAAVTQDLDRLSFNTVVARCRELTNAVAAFKPAEDDAQGQAIRAFAFETILRLLAPMIPHLTEELWQERGHAEMLTQTPWPGFDPALLVEDTITLAVQVNGKLRGTLDVAKDTPAETLETLAKDLPPVHSQIAGKTIRKVVVVPGKIVNIVAT